MATTKANILARLGSFLGISSNNGLVLPADAVNSNEAVRLGQLVSFLSGFGVGSYHDFRGTNYESGTPADVYGSGTSFGMASGQTLGVPGDNGYGTLIVNSQWSDGSGTYATSRIFIGSGPIARQYRVSDTAWSSWVTGWDSSNFSPGNYLPLHGTADNANALQGYTPASFALANAFGVVSSYGINASSLQVRMGTYSTGSQTGSVAFTPAFDHACLGAVACIRSSLDKYDTGVTSWSRTSFSFRMGGNFQSSSLNYIAVGY